MALNGLRLLAPLAKDPGRRHVRAPQRARQAEGSVVEELAHWASITCVIRQWLVPGQRV